MDIVTRNWCHEKDHPCSGYRVLIDRNWPEGESRESMLLDAWWSELGASDEVCRARLEKGADIEQLRQTYIDELNARRPDIIRYLENVPAEPLVLVSVVSSTGFKAAEILHEYLEGLLGDEENSGRFSSPPCYLADHKEWE
ncbi:DUF488 domain-containing protein [Emcibacter sp.]|uniref:DUF488 family protein, N3 subclade n=1 Tax=Emcibacter sp. TaxID=1979954 RepID=UPI003A91F418